MAEQASVSVRLVRSLIGSKRKQIATAHALGLRKIGDCSQQPDSAATQGKLRVVSHLVEVTQPAQGGAV
ncbi:MAG: 50S ribosomal protein L30 [Oscillospiraceae bacterium]|jgi:large subunit ribosomal protein L30|nr:50S ribosomal protein L30 [Oscillospiraceae bacterium]